MFYNVIRIIDVYLSHTVYESIHVNKLFDDIKCLIIGAYVERYAAMIGEDVNSSLNQGIRDRVI